MQPSQRGGRGIGLRLPPRLIAFAAIALASAARSEPAESVLVLDQDAFALSASQAGAVLHASVRGPTTLSPDVIAEVHESRSPFERLEGFAALPGEGTLLLSDLRIDPDDPGRIHRVDCPSGSSTILVESELIPEVHGLAVLPDGRLLAADEESDPSALGPDAHGGSGHGAVFLISGGDGALELVADGTVHAGFPAVPAGASAFEDPQGVAVDASSGAVYLVDLSADPLGLGHRGAVFSVDPATGAVALISSTADFVALTAVTVRADGTVLVVDALPDASAVWSIDPSHPNPTANHALLTGGLQYAYLEHVTTDAEDRVFVADSGWWDERAERFLIRPAVYRVDESETDALVNGVRVHASADLVTPVALAFSNHCPELDPFGLAVNRRVELAAGPRTPTVAGQFLEECFHPLWRLCAEEVVEQPLAGILIIDEHLPTGTDGVWFYEHSDPATMAVTASPFGLVFTAR